MQFFHVIRRFYFLLHLQDILDRLAVGAVRCVHRLVSDAVYGGHHGNGFSGGYFHPDNSLVTGTAIFDRTLISADYLRCHGDLTHPGCLVTGLGAVTLFDYIVFNIGFSGCPDNIAFYS